MDPAAPARHIPIHCSPFVVGRRADNNLCLARPSVSGRHAEIIQDGENMLLRDLGSTNGTFINGRRVHEVALLKPEDLVQFAEIPLRVRRQSGFGDTRTQNEDVCDRAMALVQFDELMSQRAVVPFFQPIIRLSDSVTLAYEVLGRSRFAGLETPGLMFRAAARLNLEVELSNMFRWEGVIASKGIGDQPHLFMNTHPTELEAPGLLESLRSLRQMAPNQPITLEIHEAAVTDVREMKRLRDDLRELNIHLAFDDFGAGQGRLVELVEIQPDCLKFDMSLVQGIAEAPIQRRKMLGTLVKMVRDLEIVPLAEGVETQEDSDACRDLGFQLGQGYFYGRPAPCSLVDVAAQRSLAE